jgi:putative transposase
MAMRAAALWNPRARVVRAASWVLAPSARALLNPKWLAIINIEDKRARERAARRAQTGKRHDQPGRLIEGQRVTGLREVLNELDIAYPGRIR